MRNKGCEVNYWILGIAYLEVLLPPEQDAAVLMKLGGAIPTK